MEQNGSHFSGCQLFFKVGKNGFNKNDHNNFRFNKIVLQYVGEAPWDASIYRK
jgi:hypothetical protein